MPEDAKKMSQTNLSKWRLKAGKTEVDDDERIPEGWKGRCKPVTRILRSY